MKTLRSLANAYIFPINVSFLSKLIIILRLLAVTNWKSITRNRTLADFKDGKISDEIAEMRLQYYEEKRRAHTKQVEETIRSGIIEDVKQEFPQAK